MRYITKYHVIRRSLYLKIRRLCRVDEGMVSPFYIKIIHYILFPLKSIYYHLVKKYGIEDIETNSYTIYGVKYSDDFFFSLSKHGINLNKPMMIIKRENGTISITELQNPRREDHDKTFKEFKKLESFKDIMFDQYFDLINILLVSFRILKR